MWLHKDVRRCDSYCVNMKQMRHLATSYFDAIPDKKKNHSSSLISSLRFNLFAHFDLDPHQLLSVSFIRWFENINTPTVKGSVSALLQISPSHSTVQLAVAATPLFFTAAVPLHLPLTPYTQNCPAVFRYFYSQWKLFQACIVEAIE